MNRLLLPYGAKKFVALLAKEGQVKSARDAAAAFAPYGSTHYATLAAKVGEGQTKQRGAGDRRRVVRLRRAV